MQARGLADGLRSQLDRVRRNGADLARALAATPALESRARSRRARSFSRHFAPRRDAFAGRVDDASRRELALGFDRGRLRSPWNYHETFSARRTTHARGGPEPHAGLLRHLLRILPPAVGHRHFARSRALARLSEAVSPFAFLHDLLLDDFTQHVSSSDFRKAFSGAIAVNGGAPCAVPKFSPARTPNCNEARDLPHRSFVASDRRALRRFECAEGIASARRRSDPGDIAGSLQRLDRRSLLVVRLLVVATLRPSRAATPRSCARLAD